MEARRLLAVNLMALRHIRHRTVSRIASRIDAEAMATPISDETASNHAMRRSPMLSLTSTRGLPRGMEEIRVSMSGTAGRSRRQTNLPGDPGKKPLELRFIHLCMADHMKHMT
jgi:hypothetical protein